MIGFNVWRSFYLYAMVSKTRERKVISISIKLLVSGKNELTGFVSSYFEFSTVFSSCGISFGRFGGCFLVFAYVHTHHFSFHYRAVLHEIMNSNDVRV